MINFQSEHNYTQLEFGDLLRAKNDLYVKMKLATINCFLDDIWKVTTPLHNNKKINLDIFYSFCFKWKALFCAYWGRVCFHFVSNLGLDKFFWALNISFDYCCSGIFIWLWRVSFFSFFWDPLKAANL